MMTWEDGGSQRLRSLLMAVQEGAAVPEGHPDPVDVPTEETAAPGAGAKATADENHGEDLNDRLQAGDVSGGDYVQQLEQSKDEVDSLKKVAVLSLESSPEKAGVAHVPTNSVAT